MRFNTTESWCKYADGRHVVATIAIHRYLLDPLANELARLAGLGFKLIPLGGPDGKQPLCQFLDEPTPLTRTLDLIRARGSMSYGIRLDGLAAEDAHEASPKFDYLSLNGLARRVFS